MKKVAIAVAVAAATTTFVSLAQTKPEDHIKQRQSAYAVLGYNFSNLAAMAQDKKPYNKDEAIRNADFVAMLATVPKGFFGEGSDHGHTRAKPEIWKNRSDFDTKMEKMTQEAAKLPQVARTGDLGALKKQVSETGGACKACHDDYRFKEFPSS